MKGLAGKRVLVTGASYGIGRAVAIRFATEGAAVAINHRDSAAEAAETERLAKEAAVAAAAGPATPADAAPQPVIVVQADVARDADVERMFAAVAEQLGGLDVLVNNAGIQIPGASHEATVATFDKVLSVNLRGAFLCARAALELFLAADAPAGATRGVILNMSSVHQIIPKPDYVSYSVSKGGMQNLTRTLALEYADRGIRVNGVGPGATVTPINRAWIDDKQARAVVESHIPMGRSGEPEEVAGLCAYLACDEASYITGQTIFIDGGLTLFPEFKEAWSS